jgi:hypothetical protein
VLITGGRTTGGVFNVEPDNRATKQLATYNDYQRKVTNGSKNRILIVLASLTIIHIYTSNAVLSHEKHEGIAGEEVCDEYARGKPCSTSPTV